MPSKYSNNNNNSRYTADATATAAAAAITNGCVRRNLKTQSIAI